MAETDETKPRAAAADIQQWMIDYITAVIDIPKDDFPTNATFDSYGLDSVELAIMCGMVEEAYGVSVESEELFEHRSVAAFSEHLSQKLAASGAPDLDTAASAR